MSIELLRRCPLFAGLKEEELTKIRNIAFSRKVWKREIIFSDGEETKGFYVILSGKIKIYKVSPEGKEQILHVVSAPDAFAEAALFLEGSYPAFAEALTDSQILFFPKKQFIQLIEKNPQLSINMIVTLSNYLKRFTLLRRKPRLRAEAYFGAQARVFRPWMNARRVPFEAPKERSRVCFGGFRLTKHVEEPWALAHGAPPPWSKNSPSKRFPLASPNI
jgi:CRP-like cAMP-binding protein